MELPDGLPHLLVPGDCVFCRLAIASKRSLTTCVSVERLLTGELLLCLRISACSLQLQKKMRLPMLSGSTEMRHLSWKNNWMAEMVQMRRALRVNRRLLVLQRLRSTLGASYHRAVCDQVSFDEYRAAESRLAKAWEDDVLLQGDSDEGYDEGFEETLSSE